MEDDNKAMSGALDAIHEVAVALSAESNLPVRVEEGLTTIISIARHKFDVRTKAEGERSSKGQEHGDNP